jgi:Lamin Tail Domain
MVMKLDYFRISGLLKLTVSLRSVFFLFGLFSFSTSHAALVINEIDYDQPGTDSAEFVELFNNGSGPLALDGYHLDLINGGDSSVYGSFDLSGMSIDAGGYLVICGDSFIVARCNLGSLPATNLIQNGAPDGVALFNDTVLLDSLSYEGAIATYTEGSATTVVDSNVFDMSLARIPNGVDTNDNLADFVSGCLTPGSANIAGTGNCTVNPVPVPAAVWLFGSGLLGLVGIAKKSAA